MSCLGGVIVAGWRRWGSEDTRHEPCGAARGRSRDPASRLRGDDCIRLGRGTAWRAEGDPAAVRTGLDLGVRDGPGGAQFVLDPSDPVARSLEPDPPAVDLHAGDAAARRLDGAPPSGRPSSPHHALAVRRCARDRRAVHAGPGADHARRRVRQLARVPVAGFVAPPASLADRVSLWKNEGKNRARWSVKGGFSAPDALYDSITKN